MVAGNVWVVITCLNYGMMACLQSALFPAVLTSVQASMQVSNFGMAALVSVYDFLQVLASVPFAELSNVIGVNRCIGVGALFSAVGGFLFAASSSFEWLVIAQGIMGIGSAALTVLAPHLMNLISRNPHQASSRLSFVYAAASLGVVVGYVVSAWIGPSQWRLLFGCNGCVLLPVAAAFLTLHCDAAAPGDSHVIVTLKLPLTRAKTISCLKGIMRSVNLAWSHPTVKFVIVSQCFVSFGVSALIAFIPEYIYRVLGKSVSEASLVMAATVPATAFGVLFSGTLAEKYSFCRVRLVQWVCCSCALAMSLAGMFFISEVSTFTFFLFIEMFVVFSTMVPSVMVFSHLLETQIVPFANALSNTALRLFGSVTGPLVLGALLDTIGREDEPIENVQLCFLFVGVVSMGCAAAASLVALQHL